MTEGHRIITMLGSSTFKKEHERESKKLSLEGYLVIPLIFYRDIPGDEAAFKDHLSTLRSICDAKVELCDIVYVVNPGGYIGKRTRYSISLAKHLGKEVWYMETPRDKVDCRIDWKSRLGNSNRH